MQNLINNLSIVIATSSLLLIHFTDISLVVLVTIATVALGVYVGNNDKKVIAQNRKYTTIRGL